MFEETTAIEDCYLQIVVVGDQPLREPKDIISLKDIECAVTSFDLCAIDTALLPLDSKYLTHLKDWMSNKAIPFIPGVPYAIFTEDFFQWMGEYPTN